MQTTCSMSFPSPVGGASLLLSFRLHRKTVVIVGANALAASRAFSALEADSTVVVLANGGEAAACEELRWRAQQKQLTILDLATLPRTSLGPNPSDGDAEALETYLSAVHDVSFVLVTDTLISGDHRRTHESAVKLANVCNVRNIPINVTDYPDLCDFTFTSTHRFTDPETHEATPLQIGVTTNGQGCRLAGRIRRDIATKLPRDVGVAVERVGQLRALAKASNGVNGAHAAEAGLNEEDSVPTPNQPVSQRSTTERETHEEAARRRMRWVAQVSEYWPISRQAVSHWQYKWTHGRYHKPCSTTPRGQRSELHPLARALPEPAAGPYTPRRLRPGPPLTLATHDALTKRVDLVLLRELVPAAVRALVPE